MKGLTAKDNLQKMAEIHLYKVGVQSPDLKNTVICKKEFPFKKTIPPSTNTGQGPFLTWKHIQMIRYEILMPSNGNKKH